MSYKLLSTLLLASTISLASLANAQQVHAKGADGPAAIVLDIADYMSNTYYSNIDPSCDNPDDEAKNILTSSEIKKLFKVANNKNVLSFSKLLGATGSMISIFKQAADLAVQAQCGDGIAAINRN